MARPDVFDSLNALTGMQGEQAQSDFESAPLPYETPAMTQGRVQQGQTQRIQYGRMKAEDLASRGIPYDTSGRGNVSEITDDTGAPLSSADKANKIAYDSSGKPVDYSQKDPTTGKRVLRNPYDFAPTQTDAAGNVYKAPKGLPWQQTGEVNPVVQQQAQAKVNAQTATALAPVEQQAKAQLTQAAKAVKISGVQTKQALQTQGIILDPNAPDAPKQLDDAFNKEYGSPEANATPFWGGGTRTPEAEALRKQIDVRKAAANEALAQHQQVVTKARQAQAQLDQVRTQRQQLQGDKMAELNRRRVAVGLDPINIGTQAGPSVADVQQQGATIDTPAPAPIAAATPPAPATPQPEPVAVTQPAPTITQNPGNVLSPEDAQKVRDITLQNADLALGPNSLVGLTNRIDQGAIDDKAASLRAQGEAATKQALARIAAEPPEAPLPANYSDSLPETGDGSKDQIPRPRPDLPADDPVQFIQSPEGSGRELPIDQYPYFLQKSVEAARARGYKPQSLTDTLTSPSMEIMGQMGPQQAGKIARSIDPTGILDAMDIHGVDRTAALLHNVTADTVNFFTSPVGVATLGIGALPKVAQRAIAAVFAGQAAHEIPNAVRDVVIAKTPEERDEAIKRAVESAAVLGGTSAHILDRARSANANIAGQEPPNPQQPALPPSPNAPEPTQPTSKSSPLALPEPSVSEPVSPAANEPAPGNQLTLRQQELASMAPNDPMRPLVELQVKQLTEGQKVAPEAQSVAEQPPAVIADQSQVPAPVHEETQPPTAAQPSQQGQIGEAPANLPNSQGQIEAPTSEKTPAVVESSSTEPIAEPEPAQAPTPKVPAKRPGASATKSAEVLPPAERDLPHVATLKPHEVLHDAKNVKLTTPKGAQFIRVTDSKGRQIVEPITNVTKGANPFHQAGPFKRVESGVMNSKKQFVPLRGEITASDANKPAAEPVAKQEPASAAKPIQSAVQDVRKFLGLTEKEAQFVLADKDPRAAIEQVREARGGRDRGDSPEHREAYIEAMDQAEKFVNDTKRKYGLEPAKSPEAASVEKLANAALALHKDSLTALGHPHAFETGETRAGSGIETDVQSQRIRVDGEKLAKATAKMTPAVRAEFVKRAVAQEVIHVGTLKYAAESAANREKLMGLTKDTELMDRAGKAYGPEWKDQSDFAKAAEAARMLLEGPEKLTEASYKFLKDFLEWMKSKLKNLSKDAREVLDGIRQKLGTYEKEKSASETKEQAPPKYEQEEKPATPEDIRGEITKLKADGDPEGLVPGLERYLAKKEKPLAAAKPQTVAEARAAYLANSRKTFATQPERAAAVAEVRKNLTEAETHEKDQKTVRSILSAYDKATKGKFGDNKIFINRLHEAMGRTGTLAEFKAKLNDLRQKGLVSLATNDLNVPEHRADRAASEIDNGKLSPYHFVNAEETRKMQQSLGAAAPDSGTPEPAAVAGASKVNESDAAKLWAEKGTDSPFFKKWFGASKVVENDGRPRILFTGQPRGLTEIPQTQRSELPLAHAFLSTNRDVAGKYSGASERGGSTDFSTGRKGRTYRVYAKIENPIDLDAPIDADAWKKKLTPADEVESKIEDGQSRKQAEREVLADALGLEEQWDEGYGDEPSRMIGYALRESGDTFPKNFNIDDVIDAKWKALSGQGFNLQDALNDSPTGKAFVLFPEIGEEMATNGKNDGYVHTDTENGGKTWIPFNPEQIKGAINNKGTFDANDSSMLAAATPEDSTKPEGESEGKPPSGSQLDRPSTEGALAKGEDTQAARNEKLMEEAEAAGLSPSLETIKGILRNDPKAMDKLRAMIKDRTGKDAINAATPEALGASNPLKSMRDTYDSLADHLTARATKKEIAYKQDAVGNIANYHGQQTGDSIRLDLPEKLDREAMPFVIEAGGDKKKMTAMVQKIAASKDPKMAAKFDPIVDHAINNFDRLDKARTNHDKIMADSLAKLKANGIDVGEVENYVSRKLDAPEAQQDMMPNPLFSGGGGAGGGNPKYFTKGRTFETLADAIKAGFQPKSTDLADLDAHRIEAAEKIIGQKKLFDELRQTPSPTDGEPIIGQMEQVKKLNGKTEAQVPRGYSVVQAGGQPLVIHNDFASIFKNLFGSSAIRTNAAGRALIKTAAVVKHGTLAVDTFHIGRMLFKMATAGGGGPLTIRNGHPAWNIHKGRALLEYTDADLGRAQAMGDITKKEADYARTNRPKIEKLMEKGMNVGKVADNLMEQAKLHLPIVSKLNSWIFGKLSRSAMLQASLVNLDRNLKNPYYTEDQAYRQTAKEMNELFGNLQNQGVLQNKTLQDISRLVFLAPNWTESQFRNEARAYAQTAKAPINAVRGRGFRIGNSARVFAAGLAALLAANQVINYLSRGQSTFENKEKDHKLDSWIPGGKRGFWFSPLEIAGEYAHAAMKYLAQRENPVDVATHIMNNKLSPMARGAKEALTGRDAQGKHFLNNTDRFRGAAVDALPVPMFTQPFMERDPRSPTGFRETRTPAAGEKQFLQSVGMKVTAAQSPRSQMFAIAQPFRADRQQNDIAGEYTAMRQALDNGNEKAVKSEIKWLYDQGKAPDQIKKAVGISASGEIKPEKFAGSEEREETMLRALKPDDRQIYAKAQADHFSNAALLLKLLPQVPAPRLTPKASKAPQPYAFH